MLLETLLLSILYTCGSATFGLLLLAVGFCLAPRLHPNNLADLLWGLLIRYGLGLGVVSAVVVWLGLFGAIRVWTVWPVLLLLAAGGLLRARTGMWIDSKSLRAGLTKEWKGLLTVERVVGILAAVWLAVVSLNLLVGALVPDTLMDSMWYHLTVPGQWVLTGRADTYPFQLHSNFALGQEAVYAALMLVGDVILCSSLYAQVSILLGLGMIVLAWRWAGPRGALWAAAGVVPYAVINSIAPVSAANDCAAALLLLLAFGELLSVVQAGSGAVETPRALRTGFLLGSAFAFKLIGAAFGIPLVGFFLFGVRGRAGRFGRFLGGYALVVAATGFAYLPWAIRGLLGSGDPVYPLLLSVFPLREPYRVGLEQFGTLPGLYPFSAAGMWEALAQGAPNKLALAAVATDFLFWIIPLAAVSLLFAREYFWRFLSLLALVFYVALFWMRGHNEVMRFFSLSYPLAAPLVGEFFRRIGSRLAPALRVALLVVLLGGGIFDYSKWQLHFANFSTIQWKFHPVLTAEAKRRYAARTECGEHYVRFEQVQDVLEPNAYVFLPQTTYLYYLKRRALWGLEGQWDAMTPADAVALVRKERFDYCIFENPQDPRVDALTAVGMIQPIPVPAWESCSWRAYRCVWQPGERTSITPPRAPHSIRPPGS